MIQRFEGEAGLPALIAALADQRLINGDEDLARQIAGDSTLHQYEPSERLIVQGSAENDLCLLVAGRVSIQVNGREVAIREAGQHVGEMALISPATPRSATVVALARTVTVRLSERAFSRLVPTYPRMWRQLAVELSERLAERSRFVDPPNPRPVLFIGSSREGLPIARAIREGLDHDDFVVRLWTNGGVFGANEYPMESLQEQVRTADFAVLVIGPDDTVTSRELTSLAPRDNVIFELGLFMGALSKERAFMVVPRGVDMKIPSDLIGLTPLEYRNGTPRELPHLLGTMCDRLREIILDKGPK